MKFEWNDEKSKLNLQKYQVSFNEAKEVFLDPMHISKLDHRKVPYQTLINALLRKKLQKV